MNEYRDIEFCIRDTKPLDVSLLKDERIIDITFEAGMGGRLPNYTGAYEVIPKAHVEQILETKNKSMTDDVTVHEIPYSEVTNPEGGKTVNIAYVL